MKKYLFSEYDGNCGKDQLFGTAEEALDFANYSWNHTTNNERERLCWCYVAEVELTEEQIAAINGGDLSVPEETQTKLVWNMGKEVV